MPEQTTLFHKIIRVSKIDSAFLYFTFEANEGLCFYSTLKESLGTSYRDIDIKGDMSTKKECEQVLNHLYSIMDIETLKDSSIIDK